MSAQLRGGGHIARVLVSSRPRAWAWVVGVVSHRTFQAGEGPLISKEPEGLRLVPALQRRDKGGQFLAAMAHDGNRSNDDNKASSP